MAHYLVVAHQTATSPQLIDRLARIARDEPYARFVMLVPATHPKHVLRREDGDRLFLWEAGEAHAMAEERALEARTLLEQAGLRLSSTIVGDDSPLLAIEDELRAHPSTYDGIVLSTLPPGISRWVRMDIRGQAQRRFDLPILLVSEGAEEESWVQKRAEPDSPSDRRALGFLGWVTGRRGLAAIAVVAIVYLAATAVLALAVDRGFFVNDAIALAVFAVFFIGLWLGERYIPARRLASRERVDAASPQGDALPR